MITFLAILAWTCFVSIPTLQFDNADDGFFVEVANLWNQGRAPFAASFDIKGVGFYAILALAEQMMGASLTTLKIVGALFSAIGAMALFRICAKYDGPAATLCAVLYPILTIISGDDAYQVMNAFLLVAFACAFSDLPLGPKALYAGLAVGFACTIKQTCAIDGIALMYILGSRASSSSNRNIALAYFMAAATIAPLSFLLFYIVSGNIGIFINDFVVVALNRGSIVPWSSVFGSFIEWMLPFSFIVAVLPIALFSWKKISTVIPLQQLIVWLTLELIVLFAQRMGYRTSMVPLIAPMLLIASIFVSMSYAVEGRTRRYRRYRALTIFGALIFGGAMLGYGDTILRLLPVIDEDALRQTVVAIEGTHPTSDSRLFVVNGPAWLNIASHLAPPTAFFHFEHTMCDFPGAGLPALAANFKARPRYVVFENPNKRLICETDAFVSEINTALDTKYRLISTVRTGRSIYQIFEIAG